MKDLPKSMQYELFKKDPLDQGRPLVVGKKELVKLKKNFTTNHYVMVMILEGEGIYIDHRTGQEYPLRPGCIFQRFIGVTHTVKMSTVENTQFYLRIPTEAYLSCKLVQNLDCSPCVFEYDLGKYNQLMNDFVEAYKDESYAVVLGAMIPLILKLHSGHRAYIPQDDGAEIIRRAARILTNDLKTDIDLEWLADAHGMSYRTFRRRFSDVFDCTPGAYRLSHKMDTASHYLKNSKQTVQDISLKLGYSSAFSFSRQFKKYFNISPTYFRDREEL
jgi:AraC family transcriptional regulator, arabinose operon regulatory protein